MKDQSNQCNGQDILSLLVPGSEDTIRLGFKSREQIDREHAEIFWTLYQDLLEIDANYLSRKDRSPRALRSAAKSCLIQLEDALMKIGGCPYSALPMPLFVLLEQLANVDQGIPSPLFHRDAGDNPLAINLLHTKAYAVAVLQRFKNENIAYKDGAKRIASALSKAGFPKSGGRTGKQSALTYRAILAWRRQAISKDHPIAKFYPDYLELVMESWTVEYHLEDLISNFQMSAVSR